MLSTFIVADDVNGTSSIKVSPELAAVGVNHSGAVAPEFTRNCWLAVPIPNLAGVDPLDE